MNPATTDPARLRVAVAFVVVVLGGGALIQWLSPDPEPAPAPDAAPVVTADRAGPEPDADPDPEPSDAADDPARRMDVHARARSFAVEYLTWIEGEPASERADRVGIHVTDGFAAVLERGRADEAPEPMTAEVIEVLDSQTGPARHEVTVIVTLVSDRHGRVRSSLGVALVNDGGEWLVEDVV